MTHEQKPESAEFRTREAQIETMTVHYMEAGFPINAARRLARDGVAEAEARGAAEQRRKDADGAEPVGFTDQDDLDRVKKGKSGDIYSSPRLEWVDEDYWPIPLYTRPANVAALEARVKELEGALAAKDREKAEAVAAEREKSEALIRSLATGYERMRRVLVNMSATSGPDTSWYRRQADQGVSSVPGIWDIARNPVEANPGECAWINRDGSMAAIREGGEHGQLA